MQIKFLRTAQQELDQAIEYYNFELKGLGKIFLEEVLSALDRIGSFPDAWGKCSKRTRRCLTRRFPYGIIYQIRDDHILIIAVSNLHRKPDYWQERV